jgi:predicted alpha/beta superfamily hydrolase
MRALVILLLLIAGRPVGAAVDSGLLQGLGDSRYHRLEAKAVEQTYHLFVRLPESYEGTGAREYPTVYLLDGGLTYPLLSGYYRYLTLGEEIPEAILVGISYGTEERSEGNSRSRDFTAEANDRDYWGGAPRFQRMLREELLPLIERTYRSDASRRVIFGQSLGGQFVLFTALTDPGLFWGHVASNPALHRNLAFFLQAPPGVRSGSRPRLFVASGSDDDARFREPALAWMAHWSGKESAPWDLQTVTLDGHSHFSAVPAAFRQGLVWLFGAQR